MDSTFSRISHRFINQYRRGSIPSMPTSENYQPAGTVIKEQEMVTPALPSKESL